MTEYLDDWHLCPCCDGVGGSHDGPLPDHQAVIASLIEAYRITLDTLERALAHERQRESAATRRIRSIVGTTP